MHTHVWSRGAIPTAPICSAPACLEKGKAVPLAAPCWKSSARPTHRALARLPPDRPWTKQFPVGRCCWGLAGAGGGCAVPGCALTPAGRGALPRSAPAARSREGPVRAASLGRPSSPSRRPGDTGAHRARIEPPSLSSAGS